MPDLLCVHAPPRGLLSHKFCVHVVFPAWFTCHPFFLMLGCQGPCEKKPCSLVWFLLLFLHCFLAVLVKPEKIDWCWLVVSRAMPGGLLYSFFLSLFAHSRHGLVHYFPVLACMLILCVPLFKVTLLFFKVYSSLDFFLYLICVL